MKNLLLNFNFNLVLTVIFLVLIAGYFVMKLRKRVNKNVIADEFERDTIFNKKVHYDIDEELTKDQKIEYSWSFLIDITEKILNFFSRDDKEIIKTSGEKLAKHGAIYNHNIDGESLVTLKIVKKRDKSQDIGKTISR